MERDSGHWHEMGEPATPAEKEALEKIRAMLPDDHVTAAWSNVSLIDQNGRVDEIDFVLLCRQGFYLVELKGWHGTIEGDTQNWVTRTQAGKIRSRWLYPRLLTAHSVRRFAATLRHVARGGQGQRLPRVEALVVMHGHDSAFKLDPLAVNGIYALDGYGITGLPKDHSFGRFLSTNPPSRTEIDPSTARVVRKVVDRIGLRPAPKLRKVAQYEIPRDAEVIDEGPTWQDIVADHPSVEGVQKRVRLFDFPPGASRQERAEIEAAAQRDFKLTDGLNHAGIESPIDCVQTDSGPALVFDYDPRAIPIDAYVDERASSLSLDDRMELIRRIGEALSFAHERRLEH